MCPCLKSDITFLFKVSRKPLSGKLKFYSFPDPQSRTYLYFLLQGMNFYLSEKMVVFLSALCLEEARVTAGGRRSG